MRPDGRGNVEDKDYSEEAKRKLSDWLDKMGPMDYDAPGTSVREQGV